MSDPTTVALESLAFSSLGPQQLEELVERLTPDDSPIQFRPYEPAEAFEVIARSTATPRLVKLALLQHWRTTPLHEQVPQDSDAIQLLAASIVSPEMLHGDALLESDAVRAEVEALFEVIDEYGTVIDDLGPPSEEDDADAYLRASYAASRAAFESTTSFIDYEDWEQPPPSCAVSVKNDVVCFRVYFEVGGVTVEVVKPLTDLMMWPSCGGGFWVGMQRIDTSDLYQEQVQLMPVWIKWITLRTHRDDTPGVRYCINYELYPTPGLDRNDGYLCVANDGQGGVEVAMKKCLKWESSWTQDGLINARATICILMLKHLQDMATACRIDIATATGGR